MLKHDIQLYCPVGTPMFATNVQSDSRDVWNAEQLCSLRFLERQRMPTRRRPQTSNINSSLVVTRELATTTPLRPRRNLQSSSVFRFRRM